MTTNLNSSQDPIAERPHSALLPKRRHDCAAILAAHQGERGLLVHRYRACAFSGAGNCCCGRQEASVLHFHRFTLARAAREQGRWFCVCGVRADEPIHREAS